MTVNWGGVGGGGFTAKQAQLGRLEEKDRERVKEDRR